MGGRFVARPGAGQERPRVFHPEKLRYAAVAPKQQTVRPRIQVSGKPAVGRHRETLLGPIEDALRQAPAAEVAQNAL
jgi:hypothetical protein